MKVGYGPISWILVSEIFPLAVRGEVRNYLNVSFYLCASLRPPRRQIISPSVLSLTHTHTITTTLTQTVALAVCANFFWNLVVTLLFDELRAALGTSLTFGLFAIISVVALAFVFFCIPETKGLSLEMIEILFNSSTSSSTAISATSGTESYYYLGNSSHNGLPVVNARTISSFFSSFFSGWNNPGTRQRQEQAARLAAQQQQQRQRAGSNNTNVLPFIEGLLPVEKKESGTVSPSSATSAAASNARDNNKAGTLTSTGRSGLQGQSNGDVV